MSLNGDNSRNFLIIGIGNPLRCDDGIGPYVAERIEAEGLNGVKVWTTQQLQLEDLERMLEFKGVVLIDASVDGQPLDFRPIQSTGGQLASSHHICAETFVSLAKSIYHKELKMELCSIRGLCFDTGDTLSPAVLERAAEAVKLICCSLKGKVVSLK